MVRTIITFIIFFVVVSIFPHAIVDAKWDVLREDDILRGDGIEGMLQDVHFMDDQNGIVVGDGGLMLVTMDGGKNWTKKEFAPRPPADVAQRQGRPTGFGRATPALYNIYFVNERVGYITGAGGTILKTEDAGETWDRKLASTGTDGQNNRQRPIRARLMGIQMINETTGFIAGTENTILKTTDGGETWIGSSERARVGETRNNLENIWFVSSTEGWIVGSFGTLLHTTDAGETWEKQDAGFDNNLFGIHFSDKNTGWICGQEGLILHTKDGGLTWNLQETNSFDNLHDIVFVDNMVGWAVGDFSAVLHTTDAGKTWTASKAGGSGALKGVSATDKNHCWTVDDWGVISAYKVE